MGAGHRGRIHSITQGFLVGEVVRRITGRSLGDFFATEVAGPLGADFHIGLAAEHDHRVALLAPPPSQSEDYASSAPGSSTAPGAGTTIRVRDGNSAGWRRAQIPAASGSATPARSPSCSRRWRAGNSAWRAPPVAGGFERALQEQFSGEDRMLGCTCARPGLRLLGSSYGWGGWGGSLVMIDPDARMAVAYVTNQMRDHGQGGNNRDWRS